MVSLNVWNVRYGVKLLKYAWDKQHIFEGRVFCMYQEGQRLCRVV